MSVGTVGRGRVELAPRAVEDKGPGCDEGQVDNGEQGVGQSEALVGRPRAIHRGVRGEDRGARDVDADERLELLASDDREEGVGEKKSQVDVHQGPVRTTVLKHTGRSKQPLREVSGEEGENVGESQGEGRDRPQENRRKGIEETVRGIKLRDKTLRIPRKCSKVAGKVTVSPKGRDETI